MVYSAELIEDNVAYVVLKNQSANIEVRIVPELGNNIFSIKFRGQEILWFPYDNLSDFKNKPQLSGVPLLAPWANRLESHVYHIKDQKITLQEVNTDVNGLPIHGLFSFVAWEISSIIADDGKAILISHFKSSTEPHTMMNFPFAHEYIMQVTLRNYTISVELEVINTSDISFPISVGFHPYFKLNSPRENWILEIPASTHVILSPRMLPTGKIEDIPEKKITLANHSFDDVFTDLEYINNWASFVLSDNYLEIRCNFTPSYPVAVVYAPTTNPVVCFEPMSAVTNAFNLIHKENSFYFQEIAPGDMWKGLFSINVKQL
ncbi:MAG: aldose 1-epimerase [Candidatus Heimdallarchaeota archaeon]|nr:aldose 1-epimerase [Candidatus Heimdallarchaeota archaeon]